ncbi:MAG: LysR family transcriptional regulator [Paracoccaceae bacterium]
MDDPDADRVALLRAFVEAARRLNFAAAARVLALPPSSLGRRIARLEARLGVARFLRSTRRVRLTEAGALYFARAEEILAALAAADAEAASLGARPAGLLRVAAPRAFVRLRLEPALPRFLAAHPDLRLDIAVSDAFVDLVDERVDVAIRVGRLADTSLRARRLAPNARRLVAAPGYLAGAPPLASPDDLARHRLLHFARLRAGEAWPLVADDDPAARETRVAVAPWMRADDAFVLREAALADLGVALLADYVVADALADGRLVEVLPGWRVPPTEIVALYAGAAPPPKTRAFIDFLVALMAPTVPRPRPTR